MKSTCLFVIYIISLNHVSTENADTCLCSNIRLVNGPSPNEGHVELFHDGDWKAVCDDEVYYDETGQQGGKFASVVCRMLGYTMGFAYHNDTSPFGQNTELHWLDNVRCDGSETSLEDCEFTTPCEDFYHIGVRCKGEADCCIKPTVHPEMRHTIVNGTKENKTVTHFNPDLQFRCVFTLNDTYLYKVNWYIDDHLIVQKGPSNVSDDLLLTEKEVRPRRLGFNVKCGVETLNAASSLNDSEVESNESMSLSFYAGFEIVEASAQLSKSGFTNVEVKLTVPVGCKYTAEGSETCIVALTMFDSEGVHNPCNIGLNVVNSDDDKLCSHKISALKQNETWDADKVFRFRVSTVDKTYNDRTEFNLRVQLADNVNHEIWNNYFRDDITVSVVNYTTYRNKLCYSHVDPHMRTGDGIYFEQQRVGEFMLYHNTVYDIEVQEATKLCNNDRAVCTCGIAVRVGADVFMIHRCGRFNYLGFARTGDGGIIDVIEVNSQKYKVITPIGTKIVIALLSGRYQNTMNVDIIMAAKDLGNVQGLCGDFDGDRSNDFLRRDGGRSSSNLDYKFSESWRLDDDKNLFKSHNRTLSKWTDRNNANCQCVTWYNGSCDPEHIQKCMNPSSITQTKIQDAKTTSNETEIERIYVLMQDTGNSSGEINNGPNITEEEARQLCNKSIYNAPAFQEFSDKTANEDPEEVIRQCTFDVMVGNDPTWADTHVDAVNNIAKNVIEINPEYVANNTDAVDTFLQQTCSKNCSNHGVCSVTGECNCTHDFRGPDCSLDIRIPPVIEDIGGGGECDKAKVTDCSCFTIRVDRIFDGFLCKLQVHTGESTEPYVNQIHYGVYKDIFTGQCCLTTELSTRISGLEIINISLSNDGINFGDSSFIYVYDTTCHDVNIFGKDSSATPHNDFCYIDGVCFANGTVSPDDECKLCNVSEQQYQLTNVCSMQFSSSQTQTTTETTISSTLSSETTTPKMNIPEIIPELKFTEMESTQDNATYTTYRPFLQFRCDFDIISDLFYIATWYINDQKFTSVGPSNISEDFVLTEHDLDGRKLGLAIVCGVEAVNIIELSIGNNDGSFNETSTIKPNETVTTQTNRTSGKSTEVFSSSFYAGFEITNEVTEVSKGEFGYLEVKQTVPIGCIYSDNRTEVCKTTLALFDPRGSASPCDIRINVVDADDTSRCFHEVQTFQVNETWKGEKIYRFQLSTVDHNYNDETEFRLRLQLSDNVDHSIWQGFRLDNISIRVTDINSYRNKHCYSHIDPHMRTADGVYYEQQRVGDYMLYHNTRYDIEVQESTVSCNRGRAVCTCGIAVRAGADVFMIHRCGRFNYMGFVKSGDGGIIDVIRVRSDTYKIITPIGTIIQVTLFRGRYESTMNVDIIMTAKDLKHVRGLCGYVDGDTSNDFLRSDGGISSNNLDYKFSESWRMPYHMNLFKNQHRSLERWTSHNEISCYCLEPYNGNCDVGQSRTCNDPSSITQSKIENTAENDKEIDRIFELIQETENISQTVDTDVTITDEAIRVCNESIYNSAAVLVFGPEIEIEDPNEVVRQCAFDVSVGNDTSWAQAHVDAINNIVKNNIELDTAFATNNTAIIETFLRQTCRNNCSSRGVCTDKGECNCQNFYQGSDCGLDVRIPPEILDIHGGGECGKAYGESCTCFMIRTEHLVDGFVCAFTVTRIHFDGRHDVIQLKQPGRFEDIFTGVCCLPKDLPIVENKITQGFMTINNISASNDDYNFGVPEMVFVFDSRCQIIDYGLEIRVYLQDGFCYIGDICIPDGDADLENACNVCNVSENPFQWLNVCPTATVTTSSTKETTSDTVTTKSLSSLKSSVPSTTTPTVTSTESPEPPLLPKIVPELKFTETENEQSNTTDTIITYIPHLQFRCDFSMLSQYFYIVTWYIDDELFKTMGPSNISENFILKEEEMENHKLGLNILCGVEAVNITELSNGSTDGFFNETSTIMPNETVNTQSNGKSEQVFSSSFYAGFEINNEVTEVSKSGLGYLEIKQTVPIGCIYSENRTEVCVTTIALFDPWGSLDPCDVGINVVAADDKSKCFHEIQTFQVNETWNGEKIYRFQLSTVDHNYNDETEFRLRLQLSDNVDHSIWQGFRLDNISVHVENFISYRNKLCYSHIDPHMKTADGVYYEQQRVGDYMLYHNTFYDIEVQEATISCNRGRAVCTCGIAVRAGADVYMIHRCGRFNYMGFVKRGDGGIIDVIPVRSDIYKIITPVGTIIEVKLFDGYYESTMNVDIIMTAKDLEYVQGLCGYFDGDMSNDFLRSDGGISSNNLDYKFSESWRLPYHTNLFKNRHRSLERWTSRNGITCSCLEPYNRNCNVSQSRTCHDPSSITQSKIENTAENDNEIERIFDMLQETENISQTVDTDVTVTDEAIRICNESIYNSAAVLVFGPEIVNEDPEEVVRQCAFDVSVGNDTSWAQAHVDAINNIVKNNIELDTAFAANNTAVIETFLRQTCRNNCSSRGVCTDKGECNCQNFYHGSDCGLDVRIPPEILDIHGGGECDKAYDESCTCFMMRTEHLVDGFVCGFTVTRIHFDGRRDMFQLKQPGRFDDIFTGLCCLPTNLPIVENETTQGFMSINNISASNDGHNFGVPKIVFVFDSRCQIVNHIKETMVYLQDGFCYIGDICIPDGDADLDNACNVCNISKNPFQWSNVCPTTTVTTRSTEEATTTTKRLSTLLSTVQSTTKLAVPTTESPAAPPLLPKIVPELKFTKRESRQDNTTYTVITYIPCLQFRCNFSILSQYLYIVTWYVDEELFTTMGPSNISENLILKEEQLQNLQLGFNVMCGYTVVNGTGHINETVKISSEVVSTSFYAGFEVINKNIEVTKGLSTIVEVKQTVPIGCTYNKNDTDICVTTLVLFNPNERLDPCEVGVNVVNADNISRCFHEIQTQKVNDTWDQEKTYSFRVSTVDHYYDDENKFSLRLQLGDNVKHPIWKGFIQDEIPVRITGFYTYRNRLCYSHIDPHMKTADGIYYEQQRVGDFMLYHNTYYDIEVHEANQLCNHNYAVCTCGIAVRAGADVFIINRCGRANILEFVRSNDGGIIDVIEVNSYRYKVITPIGTIIDIALHGGSYQNTMNVDIIMSAKDLGNVQGLCGLFDGNRYNDFLRSDGVQSSNNNDYKFSESWRLSDGINLFKTRNRYLNKWAHYSEVMCHCVEPVNGSCNSILDNICRNPSSITLSKIQNANTPEKEKELDRLYHLINNTRDISQTINTDVTITEEAIRVCNESIYNSAAVVLFGTDIINEDPEEVVRQCAFDVSIGNDTAWAEAHIDAINNIVKNNIQLNPEYANNNTEIIETFFQHTCRNNCSNHGVCTVKGECNCESFYRGPDCSLDVQIPPEILDIHGGGECDLADGGDCTCFTIRADNLVNGFVCDITVSKMYLNGGRKGVVRDRQQGLFGDIFSGVCCLSNDFSDVTNETLQDYVYAYNVTISNDGETFGEPTPIYVFDSRCQSISYGIDVRVNMQDGFCYVNGICMRNGDHETGNVCNVCNTAEHQYKWSNICPTTTITKSSTEEATPYTSTTKRFSTLSTVPSTTNPTVTSSEIPAPPLLPNIVPELKFTKTESRQDNTTDAVITYIPYLQFRCNFSIISQNFYIVTWYIDEELFTTMGPSNISENLILKEEQLKDLHFGLIVMCGYTVVNGTGHINETVKISSEVVSTSFYAGFEVINKNIEVTKGLSTIVEVKQTVPIGCTYNENDTDICVTTLVLFNPNERLDPCEVGVNVVNGADNISKCFHEIQTQKVNDTWDQEKTYSFRVSTVDHYYDDENKFSLRLQLGDNVNHPIWQGFIQDEIPVRITGFYSYRNRLCYSHIDPHMKTADGIYYEQQRVGDFMLYHNTYYDIEVQEANQLCNHNYAVCTCGIAVRAGADVFVINRCGRANILEFVRSNDGGIIDVIEVNSYRYKVITPIGTIIDIALHGGSYQNTMNVDIIMSAKDLGNVQGLCGYFDGNRYNDFLRSDGVQSSNNNDYKFSESWRLSDDMNLFKTRNRYLDKWAHHSEVMCHCALPVNGSCDFILDNICRNPSSITLSKIQNANTPEKEKELDRLYHLINNSRDLSQTINTDVTITDEAIRMCNESIFSSAAVVLFGTNIVTEDPEEVVRQCAFDVSIGNDTIWAEAHIDAINNIVKNNIQLNPDFADNNTDLIETFLQHTCKNNCSNHGVCTVKGECNCESFYRGSDCSLDVRIPPEILDIHGGGECDLADGGDCTCFAIRADNLVIGFVCDITVTKIYLNRERKGVVRDRQKGRFGDIFSGVCCLSNDFSDVTNETFQDNIYAYNVTVSNDGETFGEPTPIYVFDSRCQSINYGIDVRVNMQDGFCYISGICMRNGDQETGNMCNVCNTAEHQYRWSNICENMNSTSTSSSTTMLATTPIMTDYTSTKSTMTMQASSPTVTDGTLTSSTTTQSASSPTVTDGTSTRSTTTLSATSQTVSDGTSTSSTMTQSVTSPTVTDGASTRSTTRNSYSSPTVTDSTSTSSTTTQLSNSPTVTDSTSTSSTTTHSATSPTVNDSTSTSSTTIQSATSPKVTDGTLTSSTKTESATSPTVTDGTSTNNTVTQSPTSPAATDGTSTRSTTTLSATSPTISDGTSTSSTKTQSYSSPTVTDSTSTRSTMTESTTFRTKTNSISTSSTTTQSATSLTVPDSTSASSSTTQAATSPTVSDGTSTSSTRTQAASSSTVTDSTSTSSTRTQSATSPAVTDGTSTSSTTTESASFPTVTDGTSTSSTTTQSATSPTVTDSTSTNSTKAQSATYPTVTDSTSTSSTTTQAATSPTVTDDTSTSSTMTQSATSPKVTDSTLTSSTTTQATSSPTGTDGTSKSSTKTQSATSPAVTDDTSTSSTTTESATSPTTTNGISTSSTMTESATSQTATDGTSSSSTTRQSVSSSAVTDGTLASSSTTLSVTSPTVSSSTMTTTESTSTSSTTTESATSTTMSGNTSTSSTTTMAPSSPTVTDSTLTSSNTEMTTRSPTMIDSTSTGSTTTMSTTYPAITDSTLTSTSISNTTTVSATSPTITESVSTSSNMTQSATSPTMTTTQTEYLKPEIKPELVYQTFDIADGIGTAEGYSSILKFVCSFNMSMDGFYTVKWFVDDEMLSQRGPSRSVEDFILSEDDFTNRHLGINIRCSISEANSSKEFKSPTFFAGLKITDKQIEVPKSGYTTIEVIQTVPIGCNYSDSSPRKCTTTLLLFDPNWGSCEAGINVVNADDIHKCSVEILTTGRNDAWDGSKTYQFGLSTTDFNYDDKTKFTLSLQLTGDVDNTIWQGYKQDDIKVRVTDFTTYKNRLCYSHVGAHMKTGDGVYYRQQHEGDYMLYHNKAYGIEIQESTKRCNSEALCSCGVAIRVGGDIFMINLCGSINYIGFIRCAEGGIIEVKQLNDFQYQIGSPIGTTVILTLNWKSSQQTINIDIFLAAKDFTNIEGLCGSFDGNKSNDLRRSDGGLSRDNNDFKFSESWRLTDDNNLFTNYQRQLQTWNGNFLATCRCSNTSIGTCSTVSYRGCGTQSSSSMKCEFPKPDNRRQRRETKRLYRWMNQVESVPQSTNYNQSITLEEANRLCTQHILNAAAFTILPSKVANENASEVINQCVFDVTAGNDPMWARVHVDALNTITKSVLDLNPAFVENNNDIVETFLQQTCSTNCSNNGICSVKGTCDCNIDYVGPDCSIYIGIPPLIEDIEGNGECDKADGADCKCFEIRSDGLFDGFTCKISILRMYSNGRKEYVNEVSSPGVYKNVYTGTCCIHSGRKKRSDTNTEDFINIYEISASNDGNAFGEPESIYVYDSSCIDVSNNLTGVNITWKTDFCFIAGECVADNTTSRDNSCNICDVTVNQFNWTTVCAPTAHTTTTEARITSGNEVLDKENQKSDEDSQIIGYALGISAGVVALAAIVVTGAYFVILKKRVNRYNREKWSENAEDDTHSGSFTPHAFQTNRQSHGFFPGRALRFHASSVRDLTSSDEPTRVADFKIYHGNRYWDRNC